MHKIACELQKATSIVVYSSVSSMAMQNDGTKIGDLITRNWQLKKYYEKIKISKHNTNPIKYLRNVISERMKYNKCKKYQNIKI